jgi:3-keto-disaccharide hydrolase
LPQSETTSFPESQRHSVAARRLFRGKTVIAIGLALAILVAAAVGYKLRGVLVPPVETVIIGVPIATSQVLVLADPPTAQGPQISLFNGSDLNDWEGWLGYPDPAQTHRYFHATDPIGVGGIGRAFKIVVEDGEPAIYINGKTWGALTHKGDYGDYHLSLQFKWGKNLDSSTSHVPLDSGILYHSYGPPGAVLGTWMRSVEFDLLSRELGKFVPVGDGFSSRTTLGRDPDLFNQRRRYMIGGREVEVPGLVSWFAQNATDQEKPAGDWNTLDLYVLGDRAVHVVNGVPVLEAWNICVVAHVFGPCEPLTRGRIQLQAEGSEALFRRITLEPIKSLPRVRVVH